MEVKQEAGLKEESKNTCRRKGVKRRGCSDVSQQDGRLGACKICGCEGIGVYFGVLTCIPCKAFFIRTTAEDRTSLRCLHGNGDCVISKETRSTCKACRFQKCLDVGMARRARPKGAVDPAGQQLCVVCGNTANGVHFGAVTCEGCKKFFRRGLQKGVKYSCSHDGQCSVSAHNRNSCRACRWQKCLDCGMSRQAIQMGRPSRIGPLTSTSTSTSTRLRTSKTESDSGTDSPSSSLCSEPSPTNLSNLASVSPNPSFVGSSPGAESTMTGEENAVVEQLSESDALMQTIETLDELQFESRAQEKEEKRKTTGYGQAQAQAQNYGGQGENYEGQGQNFECQGQNFKGQGCTEQMFSARLLQAEPALTLPVVTRTSDNYTVEVSVSHAPASSQFPPLIPPVSEPDRKAMDDFEMYDQNPQSQASLSTARGNVPTSSISSVAQQALNVKETRLSSHSQGDSSGVNSEHEQSFSQGVQDNMEVDLDNFDPPEALTQTLTLNPAGSSNTTLAHTESTDLNSAQARTPSPAVTPMPSVLLDKPLELQPVSYPSSSAHRMIDEILEEQAREENAASGHSENPENLEKSMYGMEQLLKDVSEEQKLHLKLQFQKHTEFLFQKLYETNRYGLALERINTIFDTALKSTEIGNYYIYGSKIEEALKSQETKQEPQISSSSTSSVKELTGVSMEYWCQAMEPSTEILTASTGSLIGLLVMGYDFYMQRLEVSFNQVETMIEEEFHPSEVLQYSIMQYLKATGDYCNNIPGFTQLCDADRKVLIVGRFQQLALLMMANRFFDREKHVYTKHCLYMPEPDKPDYPLYEACLNYGRMCIEYEMDSIELAILSSLVLFATDIEGLQNPQVVERERSNFLQLFSIYTTSKYGSSNHRIPTLLKVIPPLRGIGVIISDIASKLIINPHQEPSEAAANTLPML